MSFERKINNKELSYEHYHFLENCHRLWYGKGTLNRNLTACAKAAGLPSIRVHDLRHSHASLLIEMGYNILLISQRLGHEKVETTWNTYAPLYPDKQEKLAEDLQKFA